ncbi:MAG: bifunctional 5,10-methylenetetrahydrofolate dehydrogenase/5,10-methenyltetrahydrofolate cyclohydrolase [Patescibacteria group bacterium]
MKIDGRAIANQILNDLAGKVTRLTQKGMVPTLAVILVGEDPGSLSYIKQKQNAAAAIGAIVLVNQQPKTITLGELEDLITQYNQNHSIHGLIIQRPLPGTLERARTILNTISPAKDVDGFVPNSAFVVPVAAAVGEILKNVKCQMSNYKELQENDFLDWLRSKQIVVIGRGETVGKPLADYLANLDCATSIVHSQTPNPTEIIKSADIIVSCVGKEQVVNKDNLKPGVILIGVGIWRDNKGKLRGDYEEEEVTAVASFYTPTPGGVGPVNVACLMKNLVEACTSFSNGKLNNL